MLYATSKKNITLWFTFIVKTWHIFNGNEVTEHDNVTVHGIYITCIMQKKLALDKETPNPNPVYI